MTLRDHLLLDDGQRRRLEDVYARYRRLYTDPEDCSPMFVVNVPLERQPTWEQRLADPWVMLKDELDAIRPHLAIEDDRVPTVRVEFGTAQVAAAFGCRIIIPANNVPAAANHVLARAEDVRALARPELTAGWYGKLFEWTELWLDNLPEGVYIQHPDIQSAFNSAHLIRGNDILLDFFDHPDDLARLLGLVTDFMIAITRRVKAMISDDEDWFYDWGALWKGYARISNCSAHMISPAFYRDHVLPHDLRFFEAVGGGRMHYCGSWGEVLDEFFRVPAITGLDYDGSYHDLYDVCERAPARVTLLQSVSVDSALGRRLLSGDWPRKRNLIITTSAPTVEAGRDLLARFRRSAPD